ncbi:MAG: YlbF family regulator [Verrucomicrobiota bacterium]
MESIVGARVEATASAGESRDSVTTLVPTIPFFSPNSTVSMDMEVLSPNSAILDKTRELCTLVLGSTEYQENLKKVSAFFNDDDAQNRYHEFNELGKMLHQKQEAGALTNADVKKFDTQRDALKADPITGGFMEAEKTLNGIVAQISELVGKSLELGRVAEPEDLADEGCCGGGGGGGCGCG